MGYFIYFDEKLRHLCTIPVPFSNSSIIQFLNSKPSRGVLVINGFYGMGKTFGLYSLAKGLVVKGRTSICIDFAQVQTMDDFVFQIKVEIMEAIQKSKPFISANDIRLINTLRDSPDYHNNYTIPEQILQKSYQILAFHIDSIKENGFNEEGYVNFLDSLEQLENSFHFCLFLLNFHDISNFNDTNGNRIGEKLLNALLSWISRRHLIHNSVPIILETKDSTLMLNKANYETMSIIQIHNNEDYNNLMKKCFNPKEHKLIYQQFGNHYLHINRINEALKSGDDIYSSINREIQFIRILINNTKLPKSFCDSQFPFTAPISFINKHIHLFKNGILMLSPMMKVTPANNAVLEVLCK